MKATLRKCFKISKITGDSSNLLCSEKRVQIDLQGSKGENGKESTGKNDHLMRHRGCLEN